MRSFNLLDCFMPVTDMVHGNRGKRSPAVVESDASVDVKTSLDDDDARRRLRRDARDTTLSVDVTLQFDGYVVRMSDVLPNNTLDLLQAPIVQKPISVIPYLLHRNQTIEIQMILPTVMPQSSFCTDRNSVTGERRDVITILLSISVNSLALDQ